MTLIFFIFLSWPHPFDVGKKCYPNFVLIFPLLMSGYSALGGDRKHLPCLASTWTV